MKKTFLKIIVLILPVLFVIAFAFRSSLIRLTYYFPECFFYKLTAWKCPACGNTRSVICLLNGDITGSLKYNITPVVLLIIAIIFYIELVFYSFGKTVHIFPRKLYVLIIILLLMISYYVLRNFV